ncbi:hypothetical protein P353_18085 [Comamonas testosteroni]|uniref:Uncharacterized protein n=1 Tax=Comamonas testosteroni TaxID=285 RepID=A0A096FCT6_COMTE|nr:hypothetical protein P353_18085 [Comamonas testosteroni]
MRGQALGQFDHPHFPPQQSLHQVVLDLKFKGLNALHILDHFAAMGAK